MKGEMENPSRPAIQRDPYEVLGISRFASNIEIKLAYRKLALRYHPDKNVDKPEASEDFKEVSFSYSILSDPERRRRYDNASLEVPINSNLSITEKASDKLGLVVDSLETSTDVSSGEDVGSVEEMPEEAILSKQTSVKLVPFIGQRFVSQDAAYEFYCSFAKQCGFSIRRHRTRGKDGVGRGITRRDFTCHRGGFPQAKQSDDHKQQRNRRSSRCGCQAYMRIVRMTDFDVTEWRVSGFSNVHNHELLKSNQIHSLPAYCTLSAEDKSRICMFAKAGMSVRQMLRLMELEKGVKVGSLLFTEVDVRNLLQSIRNVDRDSDAIDLIAMCKKIKDGDSNFTYEFKIDAHNRLEHIAWSYGSSLRSYEDFGDAVVFDTTHRLDAFDMLLGVWLGLDNHGMSCFFGCVLLKDESVQSFAWALKAFLGFMKGKTPQSILTDQNMWLKEAISLEMPTTKHAFCIWHITARFSDWFSVLLGSQYDDWKADFHRLYHMEVVEDFEAEWRKTVNVYGLHANKHIASLYALRALWALPYLRSYFCAGLTSTTHSESISALIRKVLSAQSELDHFVERVGELIDFRDHGGAKLKPESKSHKICLKTGSPMESHAATVLTPYSFTKLQQELLLAPQYASFPIEESSFLVRHHSQMDGGSNVIWVPEEELVSCSCHQFEFSGILCRHILRVLSTNNCFHIPDEYLPIRWRVNSPPTKCAKTTPSEHDERVQVLESMVSTFIAESVGSEEHIEIAIEQIGTALSRIREIPRPTNGMNDIAYGSPSESLVTPEVDDTGGIPQSFAIGNSHESFTLGSLKERQPIESVDMSRKRRRCPATCAQFGYDSNDSPLGTNEGFNVVDDIGFL
ncbi:protein FAR1-RELATED SEQUENCE 11-like isoform X1 [Typha angustifolia]|uniref:protein FAR1-RELATED SEQUENCE 11-like isoform X1 n=2 Tax=Typha angustifolia TaxID=59011 RepID=UPI003C2C2E13